MFINTVAHYLPTRIISNDYFLNVNGLTDQWILERTGIKERRRVAENENTNTMAIAAIEAAITNLPYPIQDVDIIIGALYSPYDTVATVAHVVQQKYKIENAVTMLITTACSSFINAVEICQGYFAINKASKALIITSECNSLYSQDTDPMSGHLWGDGAAVTFVSKEKVADSDMQILDCVTHGLGHVGKGPDGVFLVPKKVGLEMPFGKDVFIHACNYMRSVTEEILKKCNTTIEEVALLIPHQANMRIITNMIDQLKFPMEKVVINIDRLGNTGAASTPIGLSENKQRLKKGDKVILTVFGGGYSSGALMIKV